MSLEQIIIDRLCETNEQIGISRVRAQTAMEDVARLNKMVSDLQRQRDAVSKDRDGLAEAVDEARKRDKPISDLFLAAHEVCRAAEKPRGELRAAISKLGSAMCVAEPHVDLIPF